VLLLRFFNHVQCARGLDPFLLDMAFKCFTSEYFNVRLSGFRMILDAIGVSIRKNCPWPPYTKPIMLAEWIGHRGIIDMVFGGSGDREFVQRSSPLLQFMANQDVRTAVYSFLESLAPVHRV